MESEVPLNEGKFVTNLLVVSFHERVKVYQFFIIVIIITIINNSMGILCYVDELTKMFYFPERRNTWPCKYNPFISGRGFRILFLSEEYGTYM
jgi:hypothetical protein